MLAAPESPSWSWSGKLICCIANWLVTLLRVKLDAQTEERAGDEAKYSNETHLKHEDSSPHALGHLSLPLRWWPWWAKSLCLRSVIRRCQLEVAVPRRVGAPRPGP